MNNLNGRIVTSDLDCTDCLCAVCARNQDTSMDNSCLKHYEKVCAPCDNCRLGQELIETEDDCSEFLGDNYDEKW